MPVQRVLRSRTARTPLVALGALSVGLVCAAVLLVAGNLGKDEVFQNQFELSVKNSPLPMVGSALRVERRKRARSRRPEKLKGRMRPIPSRSLPTFSLP